MKKYLLTLLASVALPAFSFAQTTTSAISGRITAADGTPLAGATVIATHTPSSTQYGTASDANGSYRLNGMRVGGPYSVEISYVGCTTVNYDNIRLELGETKEIDASLNDSRSIETIVVNTDRYDSARNGAANNFDNSVIEKMPTISRSIYDIARLTPEAMVSKDGGISIAGANSRYNTFQIDGIVSNDIYGLTSSGTNGGLADANPIPLDAIDEIQIVIAPFDVRQSGFTGGGINAVTKSGTNSFRGTAYTYYNNQDFYGKNADSGVKLPKQSTQIYGVSLGGPIVKNKLFFFVNGEFDYNSSPSSFYAGYSPLSITAEDAQKIADRYEELTGYDGGGYGHRNVVKKSGALVARLDWNINDRHNLTLRYNYLNASMDNYSNSASSFSFNGSAYALSNQTHSLVAELNSRISKSVFNKLRVGYNRIIDGGESERLLPYVQINKLSDDNGGDKNNNIRVMIGTNPYNGMNHLEQNSISVTDNVSIYAGNHAITAGTHNEIFTNEVTYVANAFGSYTYNTLDDFLKDNSSVYVRNYPIGNPAIRTTSAQFGLYIQDEWSAARNFTLTYGIRADIPVIFDTPNENTVFNASEIAVKYGIRTDSKPKTRVMLSPRIGFRWKAADSYEYTATLRGGAGIFTGKVPFVWIKNCFSNTGTTQRGYALYNAATPAFGEEPSGETVSNPAIHAVSPDFKYPQVFRANLALEQRLRSGWRFTVEGIFSKTFNNMLIENLVAQDKGNKLYAVSADMANADNTTVFYDSSANAQFSSIYYLKNTNKGYSYSVSASVFKHFGFGMDISAAYTFGHSYTVMDGISAQAPSNWGRCYAAESNNAGLSYSLFDVPHKVTASVSYSKRYARYFGSTVSLVYQAYSGMRYSLTYYQNSLDVNGDSYRGNTPMYIPTKSELGAMRFENDEQRESFDRFIEGDRHLRSHRGQYSERNAMQTPFEHHLDLHFAQDFYFGATTGRKLQLTLDILNFGNLLCKNWGASYYQSAWKASPVEVYALDDDGAGNKTPQYRYRGATVSKNDLLSRWHMQVGVRVTF